MIVPKIRVLDLDMQILFSWLSHPVWIFRYSWTVRLILSVLFSGANPAKNETRIRAIPTVEDF
jgi:hypothetical protein